MNIVLLLSRTGIPVRLEAGLSRYTAGSYRGDEVMGQDVERVKVLDRAAMIVPAEWVGQ